MTVFETPRLRLRCIDEQDAAVVLAALNDPDFVCQVRDIGLRSEADAVSHIRERILPHYAANGFGFWLVTRRDDGAALGLCGLFRRDGLPDVDVGYVFLPAARGHGYAQEAARGCIDYGRRVLGLPRVVAYITPGNAASAAVLRGAGLRSQGLMAFPGDDAPAEWFA